MHLVHRDVRYDSNSKLKSLLLYPILIIFRYTLKHSTWVYRRFSCAVNTIFTVAKNIIFCLIGYIFVSIIIIWPRGLYTLQVLQELFAVFWWRISNSTITIRCIIFIIFCHLKKSR